MEIKDFIAIIDQQDTIEQLKIKFYEWENEGYLDDSLENDENNLFDNENIGDILDNLGNYKIENKNINDGLENTEKSLFQYVFKSEDIDEVKLMFKGALKSKEDLKEIFDTVEIKKITVQKLLIEITESLNDSDLDKVFHKWVKQEYPQESEENVLKLKEMLNNNNVGTLQNNDYTKEMFKRLVKFKEELDVKRNIEYINTPNYNFVKPYLKDIEINPSITPMTSIENSNHIEAQKKYQIDFDIIETHIKQNSAKILEDLQNKELNNISYKVKKIENNRYKFETEQEVTKFGMPKSVSMPGQVIFSVDSNQKLNSHFNLLFDNKQQAKQFVENMWDSESIKDNYRSDFKFLNSGVKVSEGIKVSYDEMNNSCNLRIQCDNVIDAQRVNNYLLSVAPKIRDAIEEVEIEQESKKILSNKIYSNFKTLTLLNPNEENKIILGIGLEVIKKGNKLYIINLDKEEELENLSMSELKLIKDQISNKMPEVKKKKEREDVTGLSSDDVFLINDTLGEQKTETSKFKNRLDNANQVIVENRSTGVASDNNKPPKTMLPKKQSLKKYLRNNSDKNNDTGINVSFNANNQSEVSPNQEMTTKDTTQGINLYTVLLKTKNQEQSKYLILNSNKVSISTKMLDDIKENDLTTITVPINSRIGRQKSHVTIEDKGNNQFTVKSPSPEGVAAVLFANGVKNPEITSGNTKEVIELCYLLSKKNPSIKPNLSNFQPPKERTKIEAAIANLDNSYSGKKLK